jgi:hypothetical protein
MVATVAVSAAGRRAWAKRLADPVCATATAHPNPGAPPKMPKFAEVNYYPSTNFGYWCPSLSLGY